MNGLALYFTYVPQGRAMPKKISGFGAEPHSNQKILYNGIIQKTRHLEIFVSGTTSEPGRCAHQYAGSAYSSSGCVSALPPSASANSFREVSPVNIA
jgi:hypothetical protein